MENDKDLNSTFNKILELFNNKSGIFSIIESHTAPIRRSHYYFNDMILNHTIHGYFIGFNCIKKNNNDIHEQYIYYPIDSVIRALMDGEKNYFFVFYKKSEDDIIEELISKNNFYIEFKD